MELFGKETRSEILFISWLKKHSKVPCCFDQGVGWPQVGSSGLQSHLHFMAALTNLRIRSILRIPALIRMQILNWALNMSKGRDYGSESFFCPDTLSNGTIPISNKNVTAIPIWNSIAKSYSSKIIILECFKILPFHTHACMFCIQVQLLQGLVDIFPYDIYLYRTSKSIVRKTSYRGNKNAPLK